MNLASIQSKLSKLEIHFFPVLLWRIPGCTGILTCCPSTTLFSLALGPTNPKPIAVAWESLVIRCLGFSPKYRYLCQHFHFLTLHKTSQSYFDADRNAPLPRHTKVCHPHLRLKFWAPLYFRRRIARPVSYYALFEWMAASKPTSWLSMQSHLLYHLNFIRDLRWRSGLFPFRLWHLAVIVWLPWNSRWYLKFI